MRELEERISIIQRLRVERDELRERIRQLEALLGTSVDKTAEYSAALGITHSQSQILGVLMQRVIVTQPQLEIILYGGTKDIKSPSLITVQIYKLRKILRPHAIVIATIYQHGYSITPSGKERVDALIAHWRSAGRSPARTVSLRANRALQELDDCTNV